MSTVFYTRLRDVADLDVPPLLGDFSEVRTLETAIDEIEETQKAAADFVGTAQISGKAADAMDAWIEELNASLETDKRTLTNASMKHIVARMAMLHARSRFVAEVHDDLISGWERTVFTDNIVVEITGLKVIGSAYLGMLERQRNAERERKCQEILDEMNSKIKGLDLPTPRGDGPIPIPIPPDDSLFEAPSIPDGGSTKYSQILPELAKSVSASPVVSSSAHNAAILSAATAGGSVLTTRALSAITPGSTSNWERPAAGEAGSTTNPINDPDQLAHLNLLDEPVNPKMTADGPVGGYVPPSTTAPSDPRWGSNFTMPPSSLSSPLTPTTETHSSSLVGGMLGVGGATALAARNSETGISGVSGMSSLVASGNASGSGLVSHVGGTGMLSSQAGVAPSRAGSVSGASGGAARTAMNTAASRGALASGSSRGAVGAHAQGRGQRDRRDEKRKNSLIGYDVLRIEDDAADEAVDPALLAHGSADALAPIDLEENDLW